MKLIKGKACYKCNRWYPLFMFKRDSRKFKLPIALGRVRNCKLCNWKESRNSVVRWNGNDFEIVKLTLKQRIKELFK